MRYLGIDYGTKRVGLALSDESGVMAFPHSVLENNANLLKSILSIIEEEEVKVVVIGHSIDKDGKENVIHEEVKELITELTLETGLPVHLEPEQYSTQEAITIQGRNKQTDASAAAIILNSFLTKSKHE